MRENSCNCCGKIENDERSFLKVKKDWNSYFNDFFGDETHNYVFCDSCWNNILVFLGNKGPKHYIVSDPYLNVATFNELEDKEKDKYDPLIFKAPC